MVLCRNANYIAIGRKNIHCNSNAGRWFSQSKQRSTRDHLDLYFFHHGLSEARDRPSAPLSPSWTLIPCLLPPTFPLSAHATRAFSLRSIRVKVELKRQLQRKAKHDELTRDRLQASQLAAAIKADRRREIQVEKQARDRVHRRVSRPLIVKVKTPILNDAFFIPTFSNC